MVEWKLTAAVALTLLALACTSGRCRQTDEEAGGSSAASSETRREESENTEDAVERRRLGHSRTRRLPERVPSVDDNSVLGEVPDELLAAILSDLAASIDVEGPDIEVLDSEAVVWSDGSLGCPQPGEVYPQSPVSGYRVLLRARGQRYDYRASASGYFKLCRLSSHGLAH